MNMMTREVSKISILMEIASRAIEVEELESQRALEDHALGAAYHDWKEANGLDRVERDTREWDRMMDATSEEYAALQKAKRLEGNARRRLKTSIRRYKEAVWNERTAKLRDIDDEPTAA